MKVKMGQSPAVNSNPLISVEKDGTVLYSNEAGKILLQELDVRVGEKLPSYIGTFVQKAISREGIEKIEIKIGKKIYFFIFYPLPEHECVNVYGFDTGVRKKFEGKLREYETQEKIDLELANIIDVKSVQSLMDDFYKLAHIPMALLNLNGNILVSAGWHEICTRFHRVNPEACRHCIESDIILSAGVAPGGYRLYKCKNNLWDVVTPIIVEGQHVGNIFSGQFFFDDEPLDCELFRSQARKYGFNEKEYIEALEKVPRLSREAVDTGMTFFMTFANMISQLSYGTIKLSRSLDERDSLVAALRESDERFRSVLENSLDSAYCLDFQKDRFDYMSPVIEQITGFSPEEIDTMTRSDLLDRIHPDDLPLVVSGIAKSLDEGFGTHEYRFKCKNGEYRWLSDHFSIIKDKTGVTRFRAGIVRDITERKQAEETLRFSNLYNRSLIESSLDPLVTIGHNGKITDVNGATEKVTGYSRRELIGTDFSDYFTEPEKARKGYQQAFTQGEVRDYPLEIRHKDGYITPVLYNASVYRDENGKIIGVFAAAHDITERKRIEEALLESESRLRLAQVAAGAGIWSWDISTDKLEWSEELFRLFDLDTRENDASFDLWRNLLHPDDRLSMERQIATAINNHTSIMIEYRIVLPSAEIRWINALGSTTYDSDGKPQRVSGICIDITERKKAEEALRLSNLYNRSLIEASLDPLVTIGHDGKITDVNKATELVTGYFRKELIGTDFSDYFTEPEKARKGYQQVFMHGEVRDYPLEIRHKDGYITPVLYNASVYRDKNGKIIGVFAAARDITERKRREANLAFLAEIDEDFDRLTSVDEIMQTVGKRIGEYLKVKTLNVCEVDDPGGMLTVNFGWQDTGVPSLLYQTFCISDYLTGEFSRAGRTGETIIIRDAQTDPRTNASAYTALEIGSVVIVPFHVKGRWKAFLSMTDTGPRDWLPYEIELVQELSNKIFPRIERIKAKEALRESEERFRALVMASSEVVYRVSPDWKEMRYLYGRGFLANTEIPSRTWLEEYVPLEDQSHVTAVINEAIRTKSTYELEHRVRLADGSIGWIFSRAVPILDANGEIIEWFGAGSDITERKRVEDALRESEERLRLLSDNLPDSAVYQYVSEPDGSTRFVYFSAGIERLNGIKVSDVLLDPGALHRQIRPEYFERLVEAEACSVRELSDFDMELPMQLPDGQVKWMRLHSRPRQLPDGRIIWDGVQTDVTEIKRAEKVLRENELRSKVTEAVIAERQRFFDVLETLPVMIALLTPDHQIAFANRYFRGKFGESGDFHCFKYCVGPTKSCKFCEAYKVLETGKPHYWEVNTPDGSVIDVYDFPFTDVDGSPMILEMDVDITERKAAEERLRDSEEKYRNIVETANEVILITDDESVITYVNPKITDMLGYPLEEVIGKSIWGFISEECRPVVRRNLEKRRQGISESYELKLIRKNGSPIWTFLNAKPLFDKEGEYAGAMSMLTDITKRKEAEEALINIEIARKKEIHHRIKNNLQVISSLLDLQAEQFRDRKNIQDSEVLEAFRESQDRVISMALIHEELYRGGGFETLNFSPYIKELTENLLLTYGLGSTDVSLNMDLEENLLFDMDIAVPLGIIVNELVSNSLKHAFPGRKKGEIRIKLHREEKGKCIENVTEHCKTISYILSVSDNGVGIPENLDIENLDSLGFQLITSLVDQLDGEFELKRNSGTEFTMRFKASQKDDMAHPGNSGIIRT